MNNISKNVYINTVETICHVDNEKLMINNYTVKVVCH